MRTYPGGKNAEGTWQWLVGHMPTHACYAELFVGSGGVLRRKVPALKSIVCDRDAAIAEYWRRLKFPGVTSLRRCGIGWLKEHGPDLGHDWLIYLDPPYLPETRVKLKLYRYEMTRQQHAELLAAAVDASRSGCRIMISGYPSRMYDAALKGWARHTRRVITRGGTWRTEVLWCNFASGADVDRANPTPGRDFRERERIKKRLRRWGGKFARMPDYERQAVLAELIRAEHAAAKSSPRPVTTRAVDHRRKR